MMQRRSLFFLIKPVIFLFSCYLPPVSNNPVQPVCVRACVRALLRPPPRCKKTSNHNHQSDLQEERREEEGLSEEGGVRGGGDLANTMDSYTLNDLRRLADSHGVAIDPRWSHDEVAAVVTPVVEAARQRQHATDAAVAGALALAAEVARGCQSRDPSGYWARLGLQPGASDAEIKAKHRSQSMLFHEDRHSGQGRDDLQHLAKEMQQQINEAKEVLSNPRTRAAYQLQGAAGIPRAELVPQNVGLKEFADHLDIIAKREKLLQLSREVDSYGLVQVRFDGSRYFAAATERIHAAAERVGLYSEEEEEEEEEEYEVLAEEEGEGAAEEDEEEEDDDDDEDGEGMLGAGGKQEMKVANVMIDGKATYVIIPNQEIQDKLQATVEGAKQQQQQQQQQQGMGPAGGAGVPAKRTLTFAQKCFYYGQYLQGKKGTDEGFHDRDGVRGLATSALGFGYMWPSLLMPHSTQVWLTHGFTHPWSAKQVSSFSCGGPEAWFNVAHSYTHSSLQEFGANLKMKQGHTTMALSWLRRLTPSLDWALKYKFWSTTSSPGSSTLQSTISKGLGDGRKLKGKLTMAPNGKDKKLGWEYSRWDAEGNSTTHNVDVGWLSVSMGLSNRLVLPRRFEAGAQVADDEDEMEALKSIGGLTTMLSQDVLTGKSMLSYRAMFHTSKKSTMNQVGFGVTTNLPYATCGIGWIYSDDPQYVLAPTHPRFNFHPLANNNFNPTRTHRCSTEFELIFQRNKFSIRIPILITTASDIPTVTSYLIAPFLVYKVCSTKSTHTHSPPPPLYPLCCLRPQAAQEVVMKPWLRMRQKAEYMKRRASNKDKLWEDRRRALRYETQKRTQSK